MLGRNNPPSALGTSGCSSHHGIPKSGTQILRGLFLSRRAQRCCWQALPGDRGHCLSPWEGHITKPRSVFQKSLVHVRHWTASQAGHHSRIPRSLLPSGGCLILFRLKLQNPSVFSLALTILATGSRFPGLWSCRQSHGSL